LLSTTCNLLSTAAGIATQDPSLFDRMNVDVGAKQLGHFFANSVGLMKVMARACSHTHTNQFNINDVATWKKEMAELSGVPFAGVKVRYASEM
jgi:glutamate synthase domain-containing protein 2